LRRIAEKELKLAQADLDRMLPLYQQNRVTEAQKDESERQVEKARNALKVLDNTLQLIPKRHERLTAQERLVRRRLDLAKLDLEKSLVTAPISGVLSHLAVEENDFVQRGMPLLKIVDPTVLEVKCNLRSDDLYWLWTSVPDQPAGEIESGRPYYEIPHAKAKVIYSVAGQQYVWQGNDSGGDAPFLARFEAAGLDDRTRTVPCRVEVPNPRRPNGDGPRTLVPGMFVEVVLEVKPQVPLLGIPEKALQPGQQVFTVKNGRLCVHRNLQVARVLDGIVWIRPGTETMLAVGDDLVVSQLPLATDGMEVRVEARP
jgi:multidrug efflux pump subunit AcrA (membrane-fusion protein)